MRLGHRIFFKSAHETKTNMAPSVDNNDVENQVAELQRLMWKAAISLNEVWLPKRCRELGLDYVGSGHESIRRGSEPVKLFLRVTTVDGKEIQPNTPEAQKFEVLRKEYDEEMTKTRETLLRMLTLIKDHYLPEHDNNARVH